MNKAVAYIRTSSNENHIDGLGSYAFQSNKIKKCALERCLNIVEYFHEENEDHDTTILERAVFLSMLKYMGENDIKTIIVESAGRICRKTLPQIELEREMSRNRNIVIECADLPNFYNTTSPTLKFIFCTLLAIIEYQEESGYNIRTWEK